MTFIRPEVAQEIRRWRETLIGTAALVVGLLFLRGGGSVFVILGAALALSGVLLALAGVQRARFRGDSGGPGVVQVTEGQLAYFGPETGGVLAMDDLRRLELDVAGGSAAWVMTRTDGTPLAIPVDALGAERLFDVFAGLPGIGTEAMLAELNRRPAARVLIWERPAGRLARAPSRLH